MPVRFWPSTTANTLAIEPCSTTKLPLHVGFIKPQFGSEHDAPFGGKGGKANRDGFAGAVAKDNLRSAPGREPEGRPPDKNLEGTSNNDVFCTSRTAVAA